MNSFHNKMSTSKRNKKSKLNKDDIFDAEKNHKKEKVLKVCKKRKNVRENLDNFIESEDEGIIEDNIVDDKAGNLEELDSRIISSKTTKKILHLAKQQKRLDEFDESSNSDSLEINISDAKENDSLESESKCILDENREGFEKKVEADEEGFVFSNYCFEEEEKNFGHFFLNKNEKDDQKEESCYFNRTKTLADLVLEKIKQKEQCEKFEQNEKALRQDEQAELDLLEEARQKKVLDIYKQVGEYLSAYKSGRIPKAFKILPNLNNWESLLYQTNPLKWSPNAMFQATRIFASNLNQKLAQRFYNLVLLPSVRENIAEHKKLNYHYYQALFFAFFKPAAWLKGILIPLLQEGCTLRECVIFGSILSKASIPVLHSSACLIKLCSITPWSSPLSYIMSILINKKYALPYKVLSAIIEYFYQFTHDKRQMPVVWHQTILVFVQRYKYQLSDVQRHCLNEVIKVHNHAKITPEIKREIHIGSFFKPCYTTNKMDALVEKEVQEFCE